MSRDKKKAGPWTADLAGLATELERALSGTRPAFTSPQEAAGVLLPHLRAIVPAVLVGPEGERVAEFLADQLASDLISTGTSEPVAPCEMAWKAVFLLHSIQPRSEIFKALVTVARSAYQRTAGALAPYVDADDLFELLRRRIWGLRPKYFGPKALTGDKAYALLKTIAHRLAIDQIRRLASRRFEPSTLEPSHLPAELPGHADEASPLLEELRAALERMAATRQQWLVDLTVEALSHVRPRDQILDEINRRFDAEGRPPWSPGAFRVFLHRFREQVRSEIASARAYLPADKSDVYEERPR